jgi:hypothetical protein
MLFRETVGVYRENDKKQINAWCDNMHSSLLQ